MNNRLIKSIFKFVLYLFILHSGLSKPLETLPNALTGTTTYLETKILSNPRHDKSNGETQLLIHSLKDRSILKEFKLDGIWYIIQFSKENKRYVLGGLFQVGAWLPMCEIRYLDEINYELIPSRINKTEWFSFISVPDESGKYIALIGQYDEKYMVLYVLNTIADRVQILGKPPQPPPIDTSYITDEMKEQDWNWGDSYADGFTELDDGIIVFANDLIKVSYGKDTPGSRSAKRKIKNYKLIK